MGEEAVLLLAGVTAHAVKAHGQGEVSVVDAGVGEEERHGDDGAKVVDLTNEYEEDGYEAYKELGYDGLFMGPFPKTEFTKGQKLGYSGPKHNVLHLAARSLTVPSQHRPFKAMIGEEGIAKWEHLFFPFAEKKCN